MSNDRSPDPLVDRVTVGIIRSSNAAVIEPSRTDAECLAAYGDEARPLAAALVDAIRETVRDELMDQARDANIGGIR
jgi:hypothetical protein